MSIQWFPGHMTKTKRKIGENITKVDIVLELLDARVPHASQNPLLAELIGDKPRIALLNKSDLSDPQENDRWVGWYQSNGRAKAMPIEATSDKSVRKIPKLCKQIVDASRKEAGQRPLERRVKAMVVGIPNVGKSSLINRLAGKKIARTGDQPAVTKKEQWVRIDATFELLDTPGILWHKFEDQRVGFYLAATGAIKDAILDIHGVASFAALTLSQQNPQALITRYKLKEVPEIGDDIIEAIGKKRGCLGPGGVIDTAKAGELFIRELRGGKLGRVTLETVAAMLEAREEAEAARLAEEDATCATPKA